MCATPIRSTNKPPPDIDDNHLLWATASLARAQVGSLRAGLGAEGCAKLYELAIWMSVHWQEEEQQRDDLRSRYFDKVGL